MHINFSVVRTLVVHHILHIRDIKTSSRNISANQDDRLSVQSLLNIILTKHDSFVFDLLHTGPEPI